MLLTLYYTHNIQHQHRYFGKTLNCNGNSSTSSASCEILASCFQDSAPSYLSQVLDLVAEEESAVVEAPLVCERLHTSLLELIVRQVLIVSIDSNLPLLELADHALLVLGGHSGYV